MDLHPLQQLLYRYSVWVHSIRLTFPQPSLHESIAEFQASIKGLIGIRLTAVLQQFEEEVWTEKVHVSLACMD